MFHGPKLKGQGLKTDSYPLCWI